MLLKSKIDCWFWAHLWSPSWTISFTQPKKWGSFNGPPSSEVISICFGTSRLSSWTTLCLLYKVKLHFPKDHRIKDVYLNQSDLKVQLCPHSKKLDHFGYKYFKKNDLTKTQPSIELTSIAIWISFSRPNQTTSSTDQLCTENHLLHE